jgi:hypothetical protein
VYTFPTGRVVKDIAAVEIYGVLNVCRRALSSRSGSLPVSSGKGRGIGLLRIISCLLLAAVAACPQTDAFVDLIHVSDTHIMNLAGVHPQMIASRRHYEPSSQTFTEFLAGVVVRQRPAFLLHTGDVTDANSFTGADWGSVGGQVEHFAKIAGRSPVPLFLALGNHDVVHYGVISGKRGAFGNQSVAGRARAEWIRLADCFREGTYYEFERIVGKTKYVFLVLDNGYKGDGDPAILAAGSKFALEQVQWLKQQVAAHRDDAVILAMHVPIGNDAASEVIKDAVSGFGRLPLVLAGHIHTPAMEEISIGSHRTWQVRTGAFGRDVNNWRLIRLREDRVEVSDVGKPEEVVRTIALTASRESK